MTGYKALDQDMRAVHGDGMQFEIGKKYTVDEKVILYKKGFHFCRDIIYLNQYYNIKDNRIFEVEAYGNIQEKDNICAAEKVKLVREFTKEEIKEYFNQNQKKFIEDKNCDIRTAVAEQGYELDKLIKDKHWQVRIAVAKQGYGLDVLIDDKHWLVRVAVAKQGYGLDKLINDKVHDVRVAVAEQGYGLDRLISDRNHDVRVAVAEQGYRLDKLIKDKDWQVRIAVAKQGYGLDILVNDKNECVRRTALNVLKCINKQIQ